jgi:hypothetical protein
MKKGNQKDVSISFVKPLFSFVNKLWIYCASILFKDKCTLSSLTQGIKCIAVVEDGVERSQVASNPSELTSATHISKYSPPPEEAGVPRKKN